ncbi:hypothetical protein D1224_08810 [Henriciella barbarensis]|uniref:Uncharacterized protein n=1 Tax=Henriciella barbarensis TaxID=86342 RepID=A0A399QYX1_9PROT|nr:hypothetical protein [Henriciella barbarensis]RIJ24326.1 hypothetical protein D1224_08810 [Henriciella barbarensis]
MKFSAVAALAMFFLAGGMADAQQREVWQTEIGTVVYDHETARGEAVLTFPIANSDQRGVAFIPQLAGNRTNRGIFYGLWIEPDGSGAPACDFAITDPETNTPRQTWGRIQITFVDPGIPSSWVLRRGYCFDDYSEFLIGRPVGGQ